METKALSEIFDCQATAAVLKAASVLPFAAHAAVLCSLLPLYKGGTPAWIAFASILVWCVVLYLSIRVNIDARFFALLSANPDGQQLDLWLREAGLRDHSKPRTIADRRRGALRLWRALILAVAAQIALLLLALLLLLA